MKTQPQQPAGGTNGRVLTSANTRASRLANYAVQYNKHKQELVEKKKKEEEEKKPKQFKARPLPKFIKSQKSSDVADGEEAKRPSSAPVTRASSQPRQNAPMHPKPIHRTRSVSSATAAAAAASSASQVPKFKAKPAPVMTTKSAPPVARIKPNVKSTANTKTLASKLVVTATKKADKPATAPVTTNGDAPKKFVAKVPAYLKKEPFKVKLADKKAPIEAKPFNLGMNGRLEARQKTDNDRRKAIEEKAKLELEEKRKKEEEEIKAMRKQREFKARGNPFGGKIAKKHDNGASEATPANGVAA